ncbi:MAG: DUF2924 domain-containing protein [Alteraurantiacibacter sp.]
MGRRAYVTVDRLADMTTDELKTEWARRYAAPTPNLSPELLRLGIAYRLQEQRLGGASRSTRALLRQLAAQPKNGERKGPPPRKLTIGTRLVRDWHGVGHTVTVLHWNGPRFFGLSEAKK